MQDLNSLSSAASAHTGIFQSQQSTAAAAATVQSFESQTSKQTDTCSRASVPWVKSLDPMYKLISRHLRAEIERGRYKAGDKLPSVRTLVTDFGVSHPTVLRALEELASLGYVKLVQGSGSFVSKRTLVPDASSPAVVHNRIKTSRAQESDNSNKESLIPVAAWQRCTRLALQEFSSTPIEAPQPGGSESLKRSISGYVRRSRGIVVDSAQVIITSGISSALALVSELCLAAGEVVAVEDPGSFKVRRMLSSHGAQIQPISLDSQGISIDSLKNLDRKVKLLHVTPSHNPTGTTMSATRRQSLLNWATHHETVILEDDFGAEYCLATNGHSSLFTHSQGGCVVHLGGFWGSLHPLLNTAYLLIPPSLVYRAMNSSTLRDSEQNLLEHRALEHMLDDGHLELHLKRNKKVLMEKRALTIASLKQTLGARVDVIANSLNGQQLVRFRTDVDTRNIVTAALRSGLALKNLDHYFVENQPNNEFLLSFSSMETKQIFDTVLHFAGLIK